MNAQLSSADDVEGSMHGVSPNPGNATMPQPVKAGSDLASRASHQVSMAVYEQAAMQQPAAAGPHLRETLGSVYFLFCCILFVLVFMSLGRTKLHFSRTLRRGIWAAASTGLLFWAISFLQALDFGSSLWDFGLVVCAGVVIASVIEDRIQRRYYLVPFSARIKRPQGTPEGIGKADYLSTLINQITSGLGATVGLAQMIARAMNVRARRLEALHDVLNSADEEELNYVLCTVNCAMLVEVAKVETMDMLTAPEHRLHELSLMTRAALMDGLMKVGMRNRPERQHFALNILLNTYSSDLTTLKGMIDDGGDYHITYKLFYNDLQGRNQVDALQHVATEGRRARSDLQRRGPHDHTPHPGVMLKIVSDIDDTLMSSGGSFPAGCDRTYPRHCIYPGVLAFYSEMDICQALRVQAMEADVADTETADGESLAGGSDSGDVSGSESAMGSSYTGGFGATGWSRPAVTGRFSLRGSSFSLGRRRSSTNAAAGRAGLLGTGAGEDLGLKDLPDRSDVAEVLSGGANFGAPADSDDEGGRAGFKETLRDAAAGARAVATLARRLAGRALGAPLAHLSVMRPRAEHLQPAVHGGETTEPVEKDEEKRPHQAGSNLVFLSARPESYEGTTEAMSYNAIFSPLIRRSELYCCPVLLLGSISSGPRSLMHYTFGLKPKHGFELQQTSAATSFYTALAGKKLVRFQEFAALYPEAVFVFVGDNGQGDVLVSEALATIFARQAERDGSPNRLAACFIHEVAPSTRAAVSSLRGRPGDEAGLRAAWAQRRIYAHGTFVGMAVQAFTMGLLDRVGLQHVGVAACKDLRWARCRYAMDSVDWAMNAAQINRDIRLANEHLPPGMQVSAIELPACERPFAFSPEHDPSSPASDSVPANGPFAAMSGSRSPVAGSSPRALAKAGAASFNALRQRMTAAPLRTPPASPARQAALHTELSDSFGSGSLRAGSTPALGTPGSDPSGAGLYGSSPPTRAVSGPGAGLPPLSAAVLERHGRGPLGLPPVAPLMPHVRPSKGPSSETDGSEATSQLRPSRPHANGGLDRTGSSRSINSAPAAGAPPATEAGRSGSSKLAAAAPPPAAGAAGPPAGGTQAAPAVPSSGPSHAAPAASNAHPGPTLPQ